MLDRANDLARLEQALRPPKARGGFGELLLANLLRDSAPGRRVPAPVHVPDGERVDAVIRVGGQLVPVDAKFPLDNFERLVEAGDDESRALHEKAFARDLKGHVDAIAQKYILPAEGTYDFALMYLPVRVRLLRARVRQDGCARSSTLMRSGSSPSLRPRSTCTCR